MFSPNTELAFFVLNIALSVASTLTLFSIWLTPTLRGMKLSKAIQALLLVQTTRGIGAGFLISGVVSPDTPREFILSAGFGDIAAAILALIAVWAIQKRNRQWLGLAWVANIFGFIDLVAAFALGISMGLEPGQLQSMFLIVTWFVPVLMVAHIVSFRMLLSKN